ncbi:MAG: helix-turn-helix domain-containing protein [Oscillospiraceae bacterium]
MPKQYPLEFKTQVVQACKQGLSIPDASERCQVAKSTLYRWMQEIHLTEDESTAVDYPALQRQNARLGHLLQIIRLSKLIDEAPLRKRLEILARLHEQFAQYSVHELCEALNVSRGTFYNHIFRKADRTKHLEEQRQLMLQVQQILTTANSGTVPKRFGSSWQRAASVWAKSVFAKS